MIYKDHIYIKYNHIKNIQLILKHIILQVVMIDIIL